MSVQESLGFSFSGYPSIAAFSEICGPDMGACASSNSGKTVPGNRVVLFLGLDGSGSTTMLYQLLLGRQLQTIPTLGNNHETIVADDIELDCWDIGGLDKMRHLWVQYSLEADGVVFIVDSTDPGRFDTAAKELARVFARDKSSDSDDDESTGDMGMPIEAPKIPENKRRLPVEELPLLIFANKQDLDDAEDVSEIEAALRIGNLPSKYKRVVGCSAMDLPSLQTGMKWMTDHFKAIGKPSPDSPVSE